MKGLAIVTNIFPHLTETFVARQVDTLKGMVITKIFNRKGTSLFTIDYSHVHELIEGTSHTLLKIDNLYKRVRYRLFKIPSYYWYPSLHKTFEKLLVNNGIKIVLAQFGPLGVNSLPVCQKLNIPLIVQFFGHDASSLLRNKYYIRDLKKVLNYASSIVVLNSTMKKELMKIGADPLKIHIINVGVPVNQIEFSKRPDSSIFQFLSVGRMVEKKSPLNVVKAFEICADENPNVCLNMVGEGPLYASVIAYLEQSKHKDKVNLLGSLTQSQLKDYYKSAHVFLQHSVTAKNGDSEGWPVGIAEACAYGLPVISTKHTGIMDQVVHGETGFLVEEHDYYSMGQFMLMMSKDMELCKRMGVASRAYVEKNGNLDIQIGKLKELIHSELNKG